MLGGGGEWYWGRFPLTETDKSWKKKCVFKEGFQRWIMFKSQLIPTSVGSFCNYIKAPIE
jgi:hypothetical protein